LRKKFQWDAVGLGTGIRRGIGIVIGGTAIRAGSLSFSLFPLPEKERDSKEKRKNEREREKRRATHKKKHQGPACTKPPSHDVDDNTATRNSTGAITSSSITFSLSCTRFLLFEPAIRF